MTKDYFPGYYVLCTGGVVQEDEKDLDNATREVEEEMGIKGVELTFHGRFKYASDAVKCWGNLYTAKYDGYGRE